MIIAVGVLFAQRSLVTAAVCRMCLGTAAVPVTCVSKRILTERRGTCCRARITLPLEERRPAVSQCRCDREPEAQRSPAGLWCARPPSELPACHDWDTAAPANPPDGPPGDRRPLSRLERSGWRPAGPPPFTLTGAARPESRSFVSSPYGPSSGWCGGSKADPSPFAAPATGQKPRAKVNSATELAR